MEDVPPKNPLVQNCPLQKRKFDLRVSLLVNVYGKEKPSLAHTGFPTSLGSDCT